MKRDRRLWWRMVTGCVLLLGVAVNLLAYAALKRLGDGHLVRIRPEWLCELAYTGASMPELLRKEADARLARADFIEAEHIGLGRVRAVLPLGSPEAYEAHKAYEEGIAELASAGDPAQAERIARTASAYRRYVDRNKGRLDPDGLVEILNRRARLEFRIAPTLGVEGVHAQLSEAHVRAYRDRLAEEGPGDGRDRPYVWLPLRERTEGLAPDLITDWHAGRMYLLLDNRPDFTMLRRPGSPSWSVMASRTADIHGQPAVSFRLDERGGRGLGALTSANKDGFLAIVLNDEVYSAPMVREPIYYQGLITGNFTAHEVTDMIRTLNRSAAFAPEIRFSLASVTLRRGGDPPKAGWKRAGLWAIAAAAMALLAVFLAAAIAGRIHLACLAALLVPLSAIIFWQVVQWNNAAARLAGIISPVGNGMVAIALAAVWILAATRSRQHGPPVLSAPGEATLSER